MNYPNSGYSCIAFEMKNAEEAWLHMRGYDIVERYGDRCNNHWLHTWDDGERYLAKCRNCGGYILVQNSEFHGIDDDCYSDYFPVTSPAEAHMLNNQFECLFPV